MVRQRRVARACTLRNCEYAFTKDAIQKHSKLSQAEHAWTHTRGQPHCRRTRRDEPKRDAETSRRECQETTKLDICISARIKRYLSHGQNVGKKAGRPLKVGFRKCDGGRRIFADSRKSKVEILGFVVQEKRVWPHLHASETVSVYR